MEFPILFSASHSSMMEFHSDSMTDSHLEFERNMVEWTRYRGTLESTQRESRAVGLSNHAKGRCLQLSDSGDRDEELERTSEPDSEDVSRENINHQTGGYQSDLYKIVPQSLFPLFTLSFAFSELLPSRKTLALVLKDRRDTSTMAPKTYTWISLWFLITFPVIFWDVGFCFFRPHSFEGGDLHWYWSPYKIYQNVDLVYGVEAYKRGDGFTNAQSLLNVVETLLNGVYLYTAHVAKWPPATLVGFTTAALTLAKTVLYWAQEYFCNYCAVGHNDAKTLLVFWILPNGLWLLFPGLIVYILGKDLVSQLNYAEKAAKMAKLQKGR